METTTPQARPMSSPAPPRPPTPTSATSEAPPDSPSQPAAGIISLSDPTRCWARLAITADQRKPWHCRPNSPAVNTGTTIAGITTDQRGITRPQGPAPDIGAYERQTAAGTLTTMSYEYLTRQAITFSFTGDASTTFSRSSYTILNQTTNQTLASSIGSFSFDGTGTQATLLLTNLLSDADYHVTSGSIDAGLFRPLRRCEPGSHSGRRRLGRLATNYGQSNRNYSQGNFNYDSIVDVGDLGILATNYGVHLGAGSAAMTTTTTMPITTAQPKASPTAKTAAAAMTVPPSPFSDLELDSDERKRTMVDAIGLA